MAKKSIFKGLVTLADKIRPKPKPGQVDYNATKKAKERKKKQKKQLEQLED